MKKNIRSGFYDDGEVHGTENKNTSGNFWRGVPGVTMIWHGEWSDPELEYEGKVANYWDIEDAMYEWATEDGVNVDSDEAFNKYCQEHDYDVYALFDNYPIESGCHGKSKKDDKKDKDDKKKPVKSAMPGREKYIQAVMEEYGCTREEAEEIIAEDIQSGRKPVKSGLDSWEGVEPTDLQIDMTNTGYFEDGWLLLNVVGDGPYNVNGHPDGTEFTINAYGPNGEDLGSKKFDFMDLWHRGPVKSSRKSVKSGLMDKTKEEQVDQLYDKIRYDVDIALNEICFKYQEILGIHTGDSWEVLDTDTPTENIVAVLKDQLIHFVK